MVRVMRACVGHGSTRSDAKTSSIVALASSTRFCRQSRRARIAWAVVQSIEELLEDPQVAANGYIADVEADGVHYRLPNVPVQFDEKPAELTRAPEHSEHTELILNEIGYGWDEIAVLQQARVIP